jgi:cell wall assembly regulator SMI1
VKIEGPNKYGPVTAQRLSKFERALGHTLPDDYRAFLLENNGGTPSPCDFTIGEGDISHVNDMYGLHDGPTHARLDHIRRVYRGRIPGHLLPIADDPGGNEICIGLSDSQRGRVYFWDHETGTMEEIAPSFRDFMDGLFEWVNPDEHAFIRMCRTHDMAELQKFIDSGVGLDTADKYDRTLLEYAAMFGHADMIERLYAAGASLRNARYYAVRNENEDLVMFLDSIGK